MSSAQQGTESDGSDMADLAGTAISVADDDNQMVALEVRNPWGRYVRVVVDRGTANAEVDFGVAIQTERFEEPVTHDTASVVGSEFHQAPAEVTA